MFAPALPPVPRRVVRPAPRLTPNPPRKPDPPPETRQASGTRPPSRLAELFAEEEAESPEEKAAAPAPPLAPQPPLPAAPPPVAAAVAVQVRRVEPTEPPPVDAPPEIVAPPIWVGVARGVAGTLAAAVLPAAVAAVRAGGTGGPAWVGELAPLPPAAVGPALAFCGTGLALFAVRPALPAPARWGATLAAGLLAGVAAKAAALGMLAGGVGPSLPLQVAVCLGVVLAATRWAPRDGAGVRGGRLAAAAGVLLCGLTFPLADGVLDQFPRHERTAAGTARAAAQWWADAAGTGLAAD